MSECPFLQRRVLHPAHHRNLKHRHQLPAFDAQHGTTENLPSVRIYQSFHKSPSLTRFDRARDPAHRYLSRSHPAALCFGFALAHSNSAKLRIGKHRVRHKPIVGRRVTSLKQIRTNDSEIVVRNVSELRSAIDITNRIYPCDIRFKPRVDLYMPALICLDSCCRKVQVFHVGLAANRSEKVRSGQRFLATTRFQSQLNFAAIVSPNLRWLGIKHQGDAVLSKNLFNLFSDVDVFTRQKVRPSLHDGDLASETAKHLAKLESYVSASDDQKVRRQLLEFHRRC